jgi:hypothetical protein
VIVSDLNIHYADQKIYAATFGRGVWMTDLLTTEMVLPDTTTTVDTTASGIETLFNETKIELFPNPNNGEFLLSIDGYHGDNLLLEVIDIMGKMVIRDELDISNGNYKSTLNFILPEGMYFLKLSQDKRMRTVKFIIE